ncbi:ribonuclease E activity regulator RraA [Halothiobacillus sp.]|uniref:ribonuclease E activity regulator RraA n=1 Tax=Halothiobacillus sp. TaxID=1891311 RepID=UPI0026218066|nr:ribonuclease E activity regulator RraA [Halothiobacillus sp.]
MSWQTADLCDTHRSFLQVAEPVFHSYGGLSRIEAPLVTVKLYEDNCALRALLSQPGEGRAIAVDVGGEYCAVLGDIMAGLAVANGWKALLINGYIRDSAQIKALPLGVWARGTCPMKSAKVAEGTTQVWVAFCGLTITPGDFLYADEDGVLIAPKRLT